MEQKEINERIKSYYAGIFFEEKDPTRFYMMLKKLSRCLLVGLDFDGTITAKGQVVVREDGKEYIIRSRKDSLLIPVVKKAGVIFAVISTEENPVVRANCDKMKIECFQGIQTGESKLDILQRKSIDIGISQEAVAFMGDDINDIPCLEWAGIAFCPSDSHIVVKEVIRRQGGIITGGIILSAEAGNGALRQLTELLLLAKGLDIKR